MAVNNGGTCVLAIEGVHAGAAGIQRTADGGLVIAFKPNIARIRLPGGTAVVDGQTYRIASVTPSPTTAGFVRLELASAT